MCTRTCQPGHLSKGGIRIVSILKSKAFHGRHALMRTGTVVVFDSLSFRPSNVSWTDLIRADSGSHRALHVSPSSLLTDRVLSGAICGRSGPTGTLNANADEYASLLYLASLALCGFFVDCPAERRK